MSCGRSRATVVLCGVRGAVVFDATARESSRLYVRGGSAMRLESARTVRQVELLCGFRRLIYASVHT